MELGEWFLAGLRQYDESLTAHFDPDEDTIHLYYHKSGKKSLAYSVKREHGELYPELQRRILAQLPEHDVWKRFGTGQAYDDYLYKTEMDRRAAAQKQLDDDRLARMKEDGRRIQHAIENARSGRFTEREAHKMEIPSGVITRKIGGQSGILKGIRNGFSKMMKKLSPKREGSLK